MTSAHDIKHRVATRGSTAAGPHLGTLGVLAHRLEGKLTGVGRYLANLLEQWAGQLDAGELPFEAISLIARDTVPEFSQRRGIRVVSVPSRLPDVLWEQALVPRHTAGLAALFCPSYTMPLMARCPSVVVTHDMLQATRPEDYPAVARLVRGPLYRLSARRAAAVVTHARATVRSIVAIYGVSVSRVHAIASAAESRFGPVAHQGDAEVRRRASIDAPYVLFVGKLLPRRRVPELIAGFGRAVERAGLPHHLVFVGPNPQGLDLDELAGAGLRGRVHYLGHVPDDDLAALYRQAALLAYLSEDEGFGLPLVEAMRSRTAVLTLDRPVAREVVESAAHLIDDAHPETVAAALERVLTDHDYRERLVESGMQQATQFDWSVSARQTMDVLVSVARR